ncbi:glycosyltransferase family 2 protein [Roseomonas eburnea]|uniref:Glycosyltransferase family 2 protein n=1 Tax=Neoroseomonas eburnea TaxID=1346889 RepID=A0A9X9X5R5_9PROT|nr:glycosyltransferase [Neoroseomonas eburnea]MBR0679051.1 glycosyltransferase family 2 protein [Neoroseomonas eburnea]
MRIALGIPTSGRAPILLETLNDLAMQTRQPERIIVCCARPEDAGHAPRQLPHVEFVQSEPGLTRQRNRIIDHARGCDLLVFLDDDFLMRRDYLAAMENLFGADPEVVAATGVVLSDGATTPGLTVADGRRILAEDHFAGDPHATSPIANAYGCNMALRLATVERHRLRFDERLPLYGWQEDAEFCCRLGAHGKVLRLDGARGVHLGTKGGRTAGVRLGYSQVVNPLYVARRVPAYTIRRAISQTARNIAANLVRVLWPEPWVDRRGRLRGNMVGLLDVMRGRAFPERMLLLGTALENPSVDSVRLRRPGRDGPQQPAERAQGVARGAGHGITHGGMRDGFEPGDATNQRAGRR